MSEIPNDVQPLTEPDDREPVGCKGAVKIADEAPYKIFALDDEIIELTWLTYDISQKDYKILEFIAEPYWKGRGTNTFLGPHPQTRQSATSHLVGGCCVKVCLFGFGGIVATVGLILALLWPLLTGRIIASQLALTEGSRSYQMWAETPIPMYFKIYMFNWTNPSTSLQGPDKPVFTQMGPYVFMEHHSKKNVTWNDNNTITYLNQKQWHFVPEMSNGSMSDRVTNLNVVAMTVGWFCLSLSKWERMAVDRLLSLHIVNESLIKTDTVGNLLFDGSDDKLLSIMYRLKPLIKNLPDMDKFGWFYKRNMSVTADGVFTMGSGVGSIDDLGLMTAWNYENRSVYPGKCGRIHGTYGEEFPPNSVYQPYITLYANDLCSVINLQRQKASSVSGIPTVLFAGDADVFSNATTCYCRNNSSCPASGVRDLGLCNKSPAMVSWPHFYLADPSYRSAVVGMSPDPDHHQFYMNMAEVTSVPLSVRGRMQLNVLMQTIPDMNMFKNIKWTVMPMMWFSQEADLTPELASQMGVLVELVKWGCWVLLGGGLVGVLLVLVGLVLQMRGVLSSADDDDRLLQ